MGNSTSSSISPHGLGMALDIDATKNPQIIYNEQSAVFFLLKKATGYDFYNPNNIPPVPKLHETKEGHETFVKLFRGTNIGELTEKYSKIQAYRTSEDRFDFGALQHNTN